VKRPKTLAGQLDELGVKPADIKAMAISHTHPDHIGNVELFPQVMLYVQKAEYEWPGADGAPRFNPNHPVTLLEGDRDVFGDGSVVIISTPGHTPGHQSLLVRSDLLRSLPATSGAEASRVLPPDQQARPIRSRA
jgi:glyoxylase-like metal-dependent hydrolase (beta-lactamase superfamily II)